MPRTRFTIAVGWLALAAGLAVVPGQSPPGKEAPKAPPGSYDEVEDPNPPKTLKRIVIPDETPVINVPRGAYYARNEELGRQAADAQNPAVKQLLTKYVVAFDRLTDSSDKTVRILPIPIYRTDPFPEKFGVFELDDRNDPQPVRVLEVTKLRKVEHYEELILAEAARLTADQQPQPAGVEPADRLAAAEYLLAAGLFFHDAARDQSKRKGRGWEAVRVALADKLADVRLRRLKLAAERKDWKLVRSLGARMAALYPNNTKLLEEVFAVRLTEAALLAASDEPGDLEQARDLLAEFEARFPGSKNDTGDRVRAALQQKAERLFRLADAELKRDEKKAQRLLRLVEAIDPNHPGLRDLLGQIKGSYTILYVGTRQLPELMTPLTARWDSELQAVELLFEGLLEALPDDPYGVKYRPALAAAMPHAAGLSRDFDLLRQAEWVGLPREYFDAADVAGTLKLLRKDYRHTWAAAGIDWLADGMRVDDRSRVRVGLAAGHPFPLSLLTTKILPARWLAARNKKLDDAGFARQPFGTGPYRLAGRSPGEVVFAANPGYARRPGRLGQPFIKEVRFVDVTGKDLASQLKADALHVLPDVPTADLSKYTDRALAGRVEVVTAANNRRVHVLAFNYNRPAVRSPALRRGIAAAIDREAILDKVFRDGKNQFHKALSGPFPPESWAAFRPLGAAAPPLFDKDLASAKFGEHTRSAGGGASLRLLVPNDDLLSLRACELARQQVNAAGAGEGAKVTLELEPVPPAEFYRRVYGDGAFDLAYVPFDYPDDLYPFGLGALLDPSATGRGGRNFLSFGDKEVGRSREDDALLSLLTEVRQHADFGRLRQLTQSLHRPFVDAMPFVPLWQLDRHLVVSRQLKLFFDDGAAPGFAKWLPPTTLFAGVARWRLE